MENKRTKGLLKASATAKLEAVANATFQHKKTIIEVVPPEVSRAKAGAWLALISPLTEWAGLKGDALRYKRDQLRIQREDSLLALAQSFRKKADGITNINPISPKLLVPILEKASLEDASDYAMIDLWANLLLSATSEQAVPPRFVSIIGELNARQAHLLIEVAEKGQSRGVGDLWQAAFEMQGHYVEEIIDRLFKREKLSFDDVYDALMPRFELEGVALNDVIVDASNGKTWSVLTTENRFGGRQSDLQILTSLGLLHEVRLLRRRNKKGIKEITVIYFVMTEMGIEFYEAVSGAPMRKMG